VLERAGVLLLTVTVAAFAGWSAMLTLRSVPSDRYLPAVAARRLTLRGAQAPRCAGGTCPALRLLVRCAAAHGDRAAARSGAPAGASAPPERRCPGAWTRCGAAANSPI
jgi:hypothetical protein